MVLAVAKGMDPVVANWALVGVLALPHIFYAYMWFNSDRWLKRFGKNAVVRFESVAWGLKGAVRDGSMTRGCRRGAVASMVR